MKKTILPIIKDNILKIYIRKPFFQNINNFAKQIDFEIKCQFSFLENMHEKYLGYFVDTNSKGIWLEFILRDFERDTKPYLR